MIKENEKHGSDIGRPTKYTEEIQQKACEYLESGYKEDGGVIPSNAGLSKYLGVNRSTVYLWGDEHREFSDTLDEIQATQEFITLNKGLTGDFNATIAKLVLANHGYHDKKDVSSNVVQIGVIQVPMPLSIEEAEKGYA